MAIASSTLLRDVLFFIKDFLKSHITDPISRPSNQEFVMTSYPTRPVTYPIITIKDLNIETTPLGFQSQDQYAVITMEIRVWALDTKTRDTIAQSIIHELRSFQIGSTGTSQAEDLHDFRVLSMINIDEDDGPKSKIITIQYTHVLD